MENPVSFTCSSCGGVTSIAVAEDGDEREVIQCANCGAPVSTVGKAHAVIAQQAAGIGADELSDDHVPLGGPPFGETN
jgi:DNA-directed RNA polymerase subunit RPC12/RpoP